MTAPLPGGADHAGDLLSALLDDELDDGLVAAVDGHLAGCPDCAEELADLRRVRAAVRDLPAVEPPVGFLDGLVAGPVAGAGGARVLELRSARRRAAATAVASVAAAVALLVVAVGAPVPGPVEPGVSGAVALHTSVLSTLGGSGAARSAPPAEQLDHRSTPSTVPWSAEEALPEPFVAPVALAGGYRLVGSYRKGAGAHLLYRSEAHALSVFERPGRCDFDALPPGGRRLTVGGRDVWRFDEPGIDGRVVVLEHGGLVFVVVGDEEGDAVLDAAASLPGPRPRSMAAQVRRVAAASLEHLAPAG